MAEIVLGIGTSHSPQLSVRAVDWQVLREKDEHDPRLDYQGLLKRAKLGIGGEITAEKFRQRDEACQAAIKVRPVDNISLNLVLTDPQELSRWSKQLGRPRFSQDAAIGDIEEVHTLLANYSGTANLASHIRMLLQNRDPIA